MISIFVRSLVFNVLLYLTMAVWIVAALPTFVMPRAVLVRMAKAWGRWNIWLMRVICGTRVKILGTGKDSKRPADLCLETSVDVGDLRAL